MDFSDSSPVLGTLDRRTAIGALGALAGAVGIGGWAAPALAATGIDRLYIFKGEYAIDGGRILDGYIAAPRGRNRLPVVLLIHDAQGYDTLAEASARAYAKAGYCAIAPNLAKTCQSASYEEWLVEIQSLAPRLKQFPLGNGKVAIARV